jgi:hypothetical protein
MTPPKTITEPGVYFGLDEVEYHAQSDWISWSGLKHLMPPNTPAHFNHHMHAPRVEKRHFDLGKVVHALVLGEGAKYEVVTSLDKAKQPRPATDYVTVSARADRDRIYAEGKTPILDFELDQALAMADAVQQHPAAAALLADGDPEVSLFWVDPETGTKCRARLDWLPTAQAGEPLSVPDLKTAARPDFVKNVADFAYYGQQEFYLRGIRECGIAQDPQFVFIAVETAAPHLVQVPRLSNEVDGLLARGVVDHCVRLYAECKASDHWPGYSDGISDISLPSYIYYRLEEFAGLASLDGVPNLELKLA